VPPEFLDLIYLISRLSDHVAKFHGDRSKDGGREAGERNKEKERKKHHEHFIRHPVTTVRAA